MQWLDSVQNGSRHSVTTPLEEIEATAAVTDVLVLEFESFRDGRGYSLASVLRERGYAGRLIAAGKLLPDQARHLRRSGFDAIELTPGADLATWQRMDAAFDAAYQPAIDPTATIWQRRTAGSSSAATLQAVADGLNDSLAGADAATILRTAMDPGLGLRIAVISSFGAESAALLHLVAEQDTSLPVVFLETGQHFLQTLQYRQQLTTQLGLTDVRLITPDATERAELDARDDLWSTDPDACCDLRKTRPLARATVGFTALITGRKRYQNSARSALQPFEILDGVLRINPLAEWTDERVENHLVSNDLPRHPLADQGYPSIGCWPCTSQVDPGQEGRAGRWSGTAKTECGIHQTRRQVATA